jgi:hypothetical protein
VPRLIILQPEIGRMYLGTFRLNKFPLFNSIASYNCNSSMTLNRSF